MKENDDWVVVIVIARYFKFQEKSGEIQTLKISDELNIDITPDGTVYGTELLNANEQINRMDGSKF